jgi:hypothetical protein
MLLKVFSTSICITTQLKCRSKRTQMPHNLQGLIIQINGGIGVPEMALEIIGQWSN